MKEIFNLNYPNWDSYLVFPSKIIEAHSQKMMGISDFRKKLQYFNKHICSLSYQLSSKGFQSFGEYDDVHGHGEMIFQFNKATEVEKEIYWQERKKEIKRLQGIIKKEDTYQNKLRSFFNCKAGQLRCDVLKVYNNDYSLFLVNGGGITPPNLLGTNTSFSLEPDSPIEIEQYNLFLREYVQGLIENPDRFHLIVKREYAGFLYEPAINSFSKQLEKALDKNSAISNELKRIETKFQFQRMSDYVILIYKHYSRNSEDWQSALFNSFADGKSYDYSRIKLTVSDISQIIHIEQCYEYYKSLIRIKKELSEKKVSERSNDAINWFNHAIEMFETDEQKLIFIDKELARNQDYLKAYDGENLFWLLGFNNMIDFRGFLIYNKYVNNKKEEIQSSFESKGASQPPILFCINLKGTISELNKKRTKFEKIELLKFTIENSGIEKGIAYYADHNNHNKDISEIWKGILSSRAGLVDYNSKDTIQYREGIEQWKSYCELKQTIENIQTGNSLYVRTDYTHRHYAIAYNLKVKFGSAKPLTRQEQNLQGGKNREKAFDSLNKASKRVYKEIKYDELKTAIELLEDDVNVKMEAQKLLDQMFKES
jgi:hypothetical protein